MPKAIVKSLSSLVFVQRSDARSIERTFDSLSAVPEVLAHKRSYHVEC